MRPPDIQLATHSPARLLLVGDLPASVQAIADELRDRLEVVRAPDAFSFGFRARHDVVVAAESGFSTLEDFERFGAVLILGGERDLKADSRVIVLPPDAGQSAIRSALQVLLRLVQTLDRVREREEIDSLLFRRHSMALELSQTGTWTRDMRTGAVEWSQELCGIFGIPFGSHPRTHEEFFEYVHPDDRERFLNAILQAVESRTDYNVEFRYRHASGEYRWMVGRGRGFYDESGNIIELAGVGIEATERKRAEFQAQERESQLRQVGDHLPNGALYQVTGTADGQRSFIYWSAGIERLLGVTAEEVMKEPHVLYGLIHPEDLPDLVAREQAALERRAVFDATVRMRHRTTGNWHWVHVRSAPRPQGEGEYVWDGLFLDVTDVKTTEEELERAMERLELAQTAGRIGVFDWDIESGNVLWSREEELLFGLSPGTFEGTIEAWLKRVHPEDVPAIRETIDDALAKRRENLSFAFRAVTPRGDVRYIEGAGRCVYGDRGLIRMVGVNVDATERTLARQAMADAARRKNEFLAMLAHELRNPLAAITSSLELCDGSDAGATEFETIFPVLKRQTAQLGRLVDDLLDVSRATLGKIDLVKAPFDIRDIVRHAEQSVRHLVEEKGHRLELRLPPEPLVASGDAARIEQVLVNLLSNAAKYTQPGGEISVTALAADSGEVVLTVRDNGTGIVPERIPQMFELFVQGDRSLDRSEGGLGIGLTLAKTIVEMHGGKVIARSEGPGRGSEFEIRIPAAQRSEIAPPVARQASAVLPPKRILVVDDHVDAAAALQRLLARSGHQVEVRHDGPGALDAVVDFQPDVIFLDLGLPEMDGYEVVAQLQSIPLRRMPEIVAVTGYGQAADIERSMQAGFAAHFTKPVEYERIAAFLNRT